MNSVLRFLKQITLFDYALITVIVGTVTILIATLVSLSKTHDGFKSKESLRQYSARQVVCFNPFNTISVVKYNTSKNRLHLILPNGNSIIAHENEISIECK